MSEQLNFYSGTIDITPQNVDQRGADLGNFDADLANIEYIVDVHAKRNDLIKALNSVYIRYATGSTADDLVDTLASGNTHTESVKTYQHDDVQGTPGATTSIRSFDINYTNEVLGRMPAQLKGKYVTNLDTGADSITFGSASAGLNVSNVSPSHRYTPDSFDQVNQTWLDTVGTAHGAGSNCFVTNLPNGATGVQIAKSADMLFEPTLTTNWTIAVVFKYMSTTDQHMGMALKESYGSKEFFIGYEGLRYKYYNYQFVTDDENTDHGSNDSVQVCIVSSDQSYAFSSSGAIDEVTGTGTATGTFKPASLAFNYRKNSERIYQEIASDVVVAEILVYDSVLSAADKTELGTFLEGSYASAALTSNTPLLVDNAGVPTVYGSTKVTFNSVAEVSTDLFGSSGYNKLNLFAGAISRALSAQMPGTGDDENILRVLIENDDYINTLQPAIKGAETSGGSTKSVNGLLHSNEVSTGYGMTMQDLLDKVFDTQLPSSRPLGHEILLALFDKAPPIPNQTLAAVGTDNTSDKRPWEISTTPGDAMFKLAYMDNLVNPATSAPIDVNLQFVIKTALTMVMRDSTTITTSVSPAGDTHVKILLNLIFDRADASTIAEQSIVSANTQVGEPYEDSVLTIYPSLAEQSTSGTHYKLTSGGTRAAYFLKETGDIVAFSDRVDKWFRIYGTSYASYNSDQRRYDGGPSVAQLEALLSLTYFAPFWLSSTALDPADTDPTTEQNTKVFMWYDGELWYQPDGYTEAKRSVRLSGFNYVGNEDVLTGIPLQARGSSRCMIPSEYTNEWVIFDKDLPTYNNFDTYVFGTMTATLTGIAYNTNDIFPDSPDNPVFRYVVLSSTASTKPPAFSS